MSETTEVTKGRPSRRKMVTITVAVLVAIALVAIVSALTGGNVTNGGSTKYALVGKHVNGFSLAGLNGGTIRAPWESGHPSVLIFFASYCGPCKSEMPKIATYLKTHSSNPVDVVAVDADDTLAPARTMVRSDDVAFPVAFDPNGKVTTGIFGFVAVPESVFVNAKGVVTALYYGAIPKDKLASGIATLKST